MNSWAGYCGSDICQTVGAMWSRGRQAPGRATAHRQDFRKLALTRKTLNKATCILKLRKKACVQQLERFFLVLRCSDSASEWEPTGAVVTCVSQLLVATTAPRTQGTRSLFDSNCQPSFLRNSGYTFINFDQSFVKTNYLWLWVLLFQEIFGNFEETLCSGVLAVVAYAGFPFHSHTLLRGALVLSIFSQRAVFGPTFFSLAHNTTRGHI